MLELVQTTPSYKKHLTSWIYEKILIKPFPLIIIVIISIFVIEALVMFFISNFISLSITSEAMVDSFLLVLVLYPLLHLLIIRPFQTEITKRKIVEEKLREHHEELGELVKERTTELLKANEKLKLEVTERKKTGEELQKRVVQLKDFYDMSIGRELRMQELRNKIERLELEINRLESELSKYKE
jgi:hypothetical protein